MNYNFDEIINRNGTDSVKWDAVESRSPLDRKSLLTHTS